MKSMGSNSTCVVPFFHGVLSWQCTLPFGDSLLGRYPTARPLAPDTGGKRLAARALSMHNAHISVHTRSAMNSLTTRVFNNGNSQAVRIPAEFRLDTERVRISRNEQGDLVLHPLRARRGAALLQTLQALAEVDEAFLTALQAERDAPLPVQEREAL
jgi:antitoxin VapB